MNLAHSQFLQNPAHYRGLVLGIYLCAALTGFWAVHTRHADIEANTDRLARERGSVLFRLIELTRDWNALHGGVYAPVTADTQANPYLKTPNRDIVDQNGRRLTMVNPAFMTRQIAELAARSEGIRFHITSLKPVRPANAADPWEQDSLREFERSGLKERLSFFPDGAGFFVGPAHRYMAPLLVKQACMKCHENQGYKVGDIRGGISITLPTQDLMNLAAHDKRHILQLYASAFLTIAALGHVLLYLSRRSLLSLQEAETRYRTVANFTYDWETWIGPDSNWIHCSPSCQQITGYPAEEFLTRKRQFLDIVHAEDRDTLRSHLADLPHSHGGINILQFRIQHREGHVVWLEHACQPVFDAQRGYLGRRASNRDITRRKQTEEALAAAKEAAEAASRSKTAFLANVSHEMRTPLHQMAGFAQLLRSEALSGKQLGRLEKLEESCAHLTTLIDAILELSCLESQDFDLQPDVFCLEDLLQELSAMLLEPAAGKHLLLLAEPAPLASPLIGDRQRLRTALLHYTSNAIRFTHQGSVILRALLQEDHGDAVTIRFEVEDTGIGITPQDIARLFTMFEQADNSATRRYGGLGLGLATTRKIAQKMGGEAGCSSTPNFGSTFWFTARLSKAPAP